MVSLYLKSNQPDIFRALVYLAFFGAAFGIRIAPLPNRLALRSGFADEIEAYPGAALARRAARLVKLPAIERGRTNITLAQSRAAIPGISAALAVWLALISRAHRINAALGAAFQRRGAGVLVGLAGLGRALRTDAEARAAVRS